MTQWSLWGACHPEYVHLDAFAGQLAALKLNVALSDLGYLPAPRGVPLGELVVVHGPCAGRTVRAVLHRAEMRFSSIKPDDDDPCFSAAELSDAMGTINGGFESCEVDLGCCALPQGGP